MLRDFLQLLAAPAILALLLAGPRRGGHAASPLARMAGLAVLLLGGIMAAVSVLVSGDDMAGVIYWLAGMRAEGSGAP